MDEDNKEHQKLKRHQKKQNSRYYEDEDYDDDYERKKNINHKAFKPSKTHSSKMYSQYYQQQQQQYLQAQQAYKRNQQNLQSNQFSSHHHKHTSNVRQCYGPGCINAARNNSKYCSDDCGVKLATKYMQPCPLVFYHFQLHLLIIYV